MLRVEAPGILLPRACRRGGITPSLHHFERPFATVAWNLAQLLSVGCFVPGLRLGYRGNRSTVVGDSFLRRGRAPAWFSSKIFVGLHLAAL
jgi:hypothetical protein